MTTEGVITVNLPLPGGREPTSLLLAVVVLLGMALLVSLGGAVFLAATSHDIPDLLKMSGTGALTGLCALLVPARTP